MRVQATKVDAQIELLRQERAWMESVLTGEYVCTPMYVYPRNASHVSCPSMAFLIALTYAGVRQELSDAKKIGEEARKEVERAKGELAEADKRAVSALEQVIIEFVPRSRMQIDGCTRQADLVRQHALCSKLFHTSETVC
jgi:hypothetical protein